MCPWVIGYSGGKDSSAVLKLVFHALRLVDCHHKLVSVIYCDTGVELPVATGLAHEVMTGFQKECHSFGLPISTKILQPRLSDRYFVKVIGRGYPPPTDKFRWCTDRLRINPVSDFLRSVDSRDAVVLLGVRQDESATRSLTLKENSLSDRFWKTQKKHSDRRLFMPILDFTIEDVWRALLRLPTPFSVAGDRVADLYSAAAGECPTIRDPVSPPCGAARFGCWNCTVAKKTETLDNLAMAGDQRYAVLREYRVWLLESRNDEHYRWKRRRNGLPGLGPMTMAWRRLALERLLAAERETGFALISEDEIRTIKTMWRKERNVV
jgi:DNA sulfur modification protein DndC